MDSFIVVQGHGRTIKITARNDGTVTVDTLRSAFQLEQDVPIGLFKNEIALECRRENNDYVFELKSNWLKAEFQLYWEEAKCSRPATPIASTSEIGSKRKRIGDEQPVDIQGYMFSDLNDSQINYIKKLKKFIFYSILTKTEYGSFENVRTIRSCVTVAKKEYAITAAHCLPDGVPEGFQFEIFNQENEPLLVQLEYTNKANDFAVLKTVKKEFRNYPEGLGYPDEGLGYTLLGYHGYNYQPTTFLSAFFGHIRNNRHFADLEYVLGSPGTTRGCSGSGVFSSLALIGIVVSGRIPPKNVYSNHMSLADHVAEACTELAEPSYNHIVPSSRIFALFNQYKLFRLSNPLPSPQAQGNQLEEAFQGAKI